MRTCAMLRWIAALALVHVLAFSVQAAGSDCAQDEKNGCPAAEEASFKPSLDSLKEYKCPPWFRDAKFGIWAHWGPQAVPMVGDWYARRMYIEGDADYVDHLKGSAIPRKPATRTSFRCGRPRSGTPIG